MLAAFLLNRLRGDKPIALWAAGTRLLLNRLRGDKHMLA